MELASDVPFASLPAIATQSIRCLSRGRRTLGRFRTVNPLFKDSFETMFETAHPNSAGGHMKAITGTNAEQQSLLDEYRIALRMWSEAKALYPLGSAEYEAATRNLNELEQGLMLSQRHDLERPSLQPAGV